MINPIKEMIKAGLALGHRSLSVLDAPYYRHPVSRQWAPVFIVGAPRSGTTLLYQLLIHTFRFAYFPNLANRFYQCPITATKWGLKLCKPYSASFISRNGVETGCLSPSEAGNVWNRWFPHENREGFNYTERGYLSEHSRSEIRTLVASMEHRFNRPFLTKNVKASVRIPALLELFPDALFVHINRTPLDAAVSILKIRRQRKKDWWSVMPKEMETIRQHPVPEQVCAQVCHVERNIIRAIRGHEDRHHTLRYEALCGNPRSTLEKLAHFLRNHGNPVRRTSHTIPDKFEISRQKTKGGFIRPDEAERMKQYMDSHYEGMRDAE